MRRKMIHICGLWIKTGPYMKKHYQLSPLKKKIKTRAIWKETSEEEDNTH